MLYKTIDKPPDGVKRTIEALAMVGRERRCVYRPQAPSGPGEPFPGMAFENRKAYKFGIVSLHLLQFCNRDLMAANPAIL